MKKKQNHEDKHKDITTQNGATEADVSQDWPVLTLDVDYFQGYLDDDDLSEDQKRELLETLWNIVVAFVDLGFGIEPVQQVIKTEGNNPQAIQNTEPDFVQTSGHFDTIEPVTTPQSSKEMQAQEDTHDI